MTEPRRQDEAAPPQRGGRSAERAARGRADRREAVLQAHQRGRIRRAWLAPAAAGVGVLALVGLTTVAGSASDPEAPAGTATAEPARLDTAATQGVCPAPPRLPQGTETDTDTEFNPVSTTASTRMQTLMLSDLAGRFPGAILRPLTGDGDGSDQELTASQPHEVRQGSPATAGEDGVPVVDSTLQTVEEPGGEDGGPAVVEVEPLGGQPAVASAVADYAASDGDLAGLAVTPCTDPAQQHWLAGATTTLGSTAVLVLSNPSASAATVDLALYGAEGPVDAPGAAGIVLAPGEVRSIVLGGLAPDEQHLAVRVDSSGGAVAATIQQHRLYGVTPGGVDIIQPTAAPATRTVIPGVVIPGADDVEQITEQTDDTGSGPQLLVAAPSSPATAEVSVHGPDGPVQLPEGGELTLETGGTGTVELSGLDRGPYTVSVEADAPVVAAARGITGGSDGPVETSQVSAAAPLGLEQVAVLPPDRNTRLVLFSAGGGTVETIPVFGDGSRGEATTREVGAGQSVAVDISAAGDGSGEDGAEDGPDVVGVLLEDPEGEVHAAVTLRTEEGISGYAVAPRSQAETGLPVRIGY